MNDLKSQIEKVVNLKWQLKILMHRYYTRDSQTIMLNLITKEMEQWPSNTPIPDDLYVRLSSPEKYAQNNIEDLCLLYRELIITNTRLNCFSR